MPRRGRLWRVVIRPALSAREAERAVQHGIGIDASDGDTILIVDRIESEEAARRRVEKVLDDHPRRVIAARPWAAGGLA